MAPETSVEALAYPLVYGTGREAIRDCVVGDVPVARGTVVLLGLDAMNRDPARYLDPDAFHPDRWLERPADRLPPAHSRRSSSGHGGARASR